MPREIQEPTVTEHERAGDTETHEEHPAFGTAIINRRQSTPGATLFDSEIRHGEYVVLTINEATRDRTLHRDWIHGGKTIVEVGMSKAQWADLVSSFGNGSGVPVTIQYREGVGPVPGFPFQPRLAQSTAEVTGAADRMYDKVMAALAAVEEKPTKANIRDLRITLENAPKNVAYAAKTLTEHVENVVTKARADVEAMVQMEAERIGLEVGRDLALGIMAPDPTPLELETVEGEVVE